MFSLPLSLPYSCNIVQLDQTVPREYDIHNNTKQTIILSHSLPCQNKYQLQIDNSQWPLHEEKKRNYHHMRVT